MLLLAALLAVPAACGGGGRDAGGAAAPRAAFRVLVFSKTTGYRHPSIADGVAAIRRLGRADGFGVDHTEDERRFTDRRLAAYDALVFLSTTGEPLAQAAHRRALQRYVRRGGGFLGIHAASDAFYRWPWYVGLVGASFRRHAPGTAAAAVVVEDRSAAATRGLPRVWRRVDEWYAFRANPRGRVHVLATLDERTYDPHDAAMGADHPIAWCHRYDGGRSVYTAMGHTRASYAEPRFAAQLLGAIRMAAGRAPFRCPAGPAAG
ncbi:MAG TPA: ThuA domain-containing protein [Solirubrobacteraceae bacterium]|nr:ThuA domain-containing protein [Solirubrobacteraceae bacterium]